MANIQSSIKRIRTTRRRTEFNQITRSTARTYIKRARTLIEQGNLDQAALVVKQATTALDKAAQKGVIHRNNAARRKSRLLKTLHKAQGEA